MGIGAWTNYGTTALKGFMWQSAANGGRLRRIKTAVEHNTCTLYTQQEQLLWAG
jgi:hypothetical protein